MVEGCICLENTKASDRHRTANATGRNIVTTDAKIELDFPMQAGLLDRARIVARPGFNRWLVPPAALAIHLCIGMAYGFSVFWLPLSQVLDAQQPAACADLNLLSALFTTSCNWRISAPA